MAKIIEKVFLGWQAAFSFTVYIRLLLSLVSKTFCFLLSINITILTNSIFLNVLSVSSTRLKERKKDFNANDGE